MSDWEHGIALHAMQGNLASSHSEGEVSLFFSSCCRKLGYILKLQSGWPLKTRFCSRRQDYSLLTRETSGISTRLGREIRTLLEVRWETECLFLVAQ